MDDNALNTPVAVEPVVAVAAPETVTTEPVVAPQEVTPQEVAPASVAPRSVYVYATAVRQIDGGDKGDMVTFAVDFSVSADGLDGSYTNNIVTKLFQVNKQTLADEMMRNISTSKVTVVEEKKEKDVRDISAQRIRELAGLPHSKNFV